ncbi:MAG: Clp protease ClpP [Ruminococcus sp.]|nr:Clp protease ClpP [Ruminococcus sp.]
MKNKFFDLKMNANTPKTLDLYIYTDVESDYWDWWTGEQVESQTSAEHIRKELEAAGDVTQINIYINSLGGSVMEGMSIYNQLRRHKAHKTVYIDGFACSVASVIAMAGDEVVMPSNTMMMIHAPLLCVRGHSADLRKAADELDKISLSTMQAYLQKAGGKLTAEKLAEMYEQETYWSAAECISLGLADRMADADIDLEAAIAALENSENGECRQMIDRLKTAAAKAASPPTAEQVSEQVGSPILQSTAKVEQTETKQPENAEVPACPKMTGGTDMGHSESSKTDFISIAENKITKFFRL